MSGYSITRTYPHPVGKVWQVLTDPELVPLWTTTGQGGRPEGFAPVVGTRFRFVAKPTMGWRGIVDCEVIDARPPALLRYTWVGDEGGRPTYVSYRLEPAGAGTTFTCEHTGFSGVGGFVMARLLGSVRTKMLDEGLPAALDAVDDQGRPKAAARPLR